MKAKVLCFNCSAAEMKVLQESAQAVGAVVLNVPQADFSQPVGAIIGVLPRENRVCFTPFAEKMIIMASFDQTKMEAFLNALRTASLYLPYKAMVTPANILWQCDVLLEHLKQEHAQMSKRKQSNE